jgi:mRNA interferase MazF
MSSKERNAWRGGPKSREAASLSTRLTGLPKDSVANVSQIVSVDKDFLTARVGKLPLSKMELILSGIAVVLGK